jgi:ribosomal protein L29
MIWEWRLGNDGLRRVSLEERQESWRGIKDSYFRIASNKSASHVDNPRKTYVTS